MTSRLERALRISRAKTFPSQVAPFRTRQAAEWIRRHFGEAQSSLPASVSPTEALIRIRRHLDAGGTLASLERRLRRGLGQILFWDDGSGIGPLAARPEIIPQTQELFDANPNQYLPGILQAFLVSYPREDRHFEPWRALLQAALRQGADRFTRRMQKVEEQFGFLADDGPARIASRMLQEEPNAREAWERIFPFGADDHSPLLRLAMNELLASIQQHLESDAMDATVLVQVLQHFGTEDTRWRRAWRVPLVVGLLTPFHHRDPHDEVVRNTIEDFLLEALGDPRMTADAQGSEMNWQGICADCRNAMLRWMVRRSFERFFSVIERGVAGNEIGDEHWESRRRFWGRLVNVGVVAEAWPVFGPAAAAEARRRGIPPSEYGTIVDPSSAHSSAFVMRLRGTRGSILAVEWSDNGMFRGWELDHPEAPRLYRNQYSERTIRTTRDETLLFKRTHQGAWERRFLGEIVRQVGTPVERQLG